MKNNLQQCGGIVPDLSNAISSKIQVQAATFHTCPNCGAVINKLPEPRRIHRQRAKGWRMPENTICVTRPGPFGNPFKIVGDQIYCDASNRRGRYLSPWILAGPLRSDFYTKPIGEVVILLYENWLNKGDDVKELCMIEPPTIDTIKAKLHGKNLACFCKPGAHCHADILLKIANS